MWTSHADCFAVLHIAFLYYLFSSDGCFAVLHVYLYYPDYHD